jgi:hypothetical protein
MLVHSVAHNPTQCGSNTPKFRLKRLKADKLVQIWESFLALKTKTAQGLTPRGFTVECQILSKLIVNHG